MDSALMQAAWPRPHQTGGKQPFLFRFLRNNTARTALVVTRLGNPGTAAITRGKGISMSMVQSPAGVAGRQRVFGNEHAEFSVSTQSHNQRFSALRPLAVAVCVLGLMVSTMGATLVSAQESDAGGYTYAEMGYNDPNEAAEALAQDAGTSGDVIANYAMQFLGYPYVWAGNSAAGFDCSGFTQFVLLNTLGIDIGHGVAEQTGYGSWVNWGEWQPGDLVYFAGTYRAGISHTGVYIGDGQFIHAENEGTGVVISSLYSDYYGGHYYGAYRHV